MVAYQFQTFVWRFASLLSLLFHPSAFIVAEVRVRALVNPTVILGEIGSNICPEEYDKINDYRMCVAAMDIIGPGNSDLDPTAYPASSFDTETDSDWPSGCYTYDDNENNHLVYFNKHPTGKEEPSATPICVKKLESIKVGETLYMGDSDVDYWSPRPSFSYNVGVGGDTCKDVMGDVKPFLDYFQPSIVVLVCGSNDLIEKSVALTSNRLRSAATRMNQQGSAVIFMGTKDDPSSPELWNDYSDFDNAAREYAKTNCDTLVAGRPAFTFIDVNAAFTDVQNPASFYAPDELHLSDEAYALWTKWVATALKEPNCCIWKSNKCIYSATTKAPNKSVTISPTSPPNKNVTVRFTSTTASTSTTTTTRITTTTTTSSSTSTN